MKAEFDPRAEEALLLVTVEKNFQETNSSSPFPYQSVKSEAVDRINIESITMHALLGKCFDVRLLCKYTNVRNQ